VRTLLEKIGSGKRSITGRFQPPLMSQVPKANQFSPGVKQHELRPTGQPSVPSAAVSTTRKTTTTCTSIETLDEIFLSPAQVAQRWSFHVESVRRKIRRRELGSILIGRRRLIPLSELKRIESEGRIPARALGCANQ
jgi:excisionase family DNA binding protein